jgi:glycogen(starch) synthase
VRVLTVGNMYPPHHLGGYELVWRSAVEHLRAGGHEVTVLTTDHRRDGVAEPDPPHVHRDLRWWWRDHAWPRFGPFAQRRLERDNHAVLDERLATDEPDIVVWLAMGGMTLSLLERVREQGIPALGVVHDDWLLYGPRVDKRYPGVDFDGAARWLFVSDFTRRKALEQLVLSDTGVLHSGIDERHLRPLGPPRDWGWHVVSVGRIDPRKGIDTAIRALAQLPAEAHLTIAGEGDDAELRRLQALVAELGLGDRVVFAGFQDPAALYARADAVVFPVTWDEPWGLVPLEAMAHGVPVIATGRGGSAEYLRDGENALLHAAGDAAALAAALERLAGDPGLRERLRAAGAQTAPLHTERRFNEGLEAEITNKVARA